jgi:hypothetical protein
MNHCLRYRIDGTEYSITLHGSEEEARSHAENLGLEYLGELQAEKEISDQRVEHIKQTLSYSTTH